MKTKIKNIYTNEVIHSFDGTIKECVEDAVKKGISLAYANLYSANLYSANLESANLESANLYSANKVPIYCKWSIGITNGNLIHIGCEKRTIEEWDAFFASDKELSTKRNTSDFKQIEAVYLAYKSYLTHLQS